MATAPWRPLALLGFAAALLGAPAEAETLRPPPPPRAPVAVREVAVINHAAHPVFQLKVSFSEADQWGDDRLGEATVPPGGTFRVRLGRTGDCLFDIQVIYDDLSHEERRGVDLCRIRAVTFDGTTATKPTELFAVPRGIRLENRGPRPLRQVFVSRASAEQWGDDLAPPGGIAPRASGAIVYRGGCTADLRVVYDNRAAEERRGLDLCASPALIIRPGWTTDDEPPAPPAPGSLRLVNRTGHPITALHLRAEPHHGAESPDLLGAGLLPAGGSLDVPFDRGADCRFTLRASYGGDLADLALRGIDLCGDSTIELTNSPTIR